jgi:hypothetical protein
MNNNIIRKLHPKVTGETLSSETSANNQDKIGSYKDNRTGTLRGAPSVVWYSTDTKLVLDTITTGIDYNIYINGYNMDMVSNIYLSGSNAEMFPGTPEVYNYFEQTYATDHRLSTENPAITAHALSSWTVTDNNNIIIDIPLALQPGDLEIILQGPAGYSNVFDDSVMLLTVTGEAITSTETTGTTATTGTETTGTTATTGTETTGTSATTGTETTGTTATTGTETTGTTATTDSANGQYISDHLQNL